MKIKLLIGLITMFTLTTSRIYASFEQRIIQVSSSTVTTIGSDYNNRDVYIQNPDVNVYIRYRVDGSTVNIASGGDSGKGYGYYLPAWQGQVISTRDPIYLQLEAGESDVYANVLIERN